MFNSTKKVLALAAVAFTAQAFAAEVVAEKDWTILVFLNGNNNLDSYGAGDINEMEKVGSSDRVNVVVEWASYSARKSKRLWVKKDTNANTVTSPILQDLGKVDMGDYKELTKFIQWGVQNYPAKHYLIDIWNHGNGWQKNNVRPELFKDVSYDDFSGNRITTEQLGTAMAEAKTIIGKNVDILGFDACLMAMGEVGGEIADSTDYLVGSEDTEPGDGWPYDDFLKSITEGTTEKSATEVGAALVKTYVASYNNGSQGSADAHLATHDLKALKDMYPALKNLATALNQVASTSPQALNDAIQNTHGFYGSDYKDLGDFVGQLQTRNVGVDANVLQAVSTQLKNVVTSTEALGSNKPSQGLSVWVPSYSSSWSEYGDRYKGFNFDKETGWSKWIENIAQSQENIVNGGIEQ
jgi:hypothetical protein